MKDSLRRTLIEKRKHYKNGQGDSSIIEVKFWEIPSVYNAEIFMLYYPHKNEVDTTGIIRRLFEKGKTVLLPKVEGKHIVPVKVENLNRLNTGYAGIKEPSGKPFEGKIDIIVVPAVAFDIRGYRLGYGKGFYDRFLERKEDTLKIGLAYDFQILDQIPVHQHDVPVDIIITPTKTIKTKKED